MKPRTAFTLLEETAAQYPDRIAMNQPSAGQMETYSWAGFESAVREVAAGLRHLGIRKGDVAGLLSETRAEFYVADLGALANGSIAAAAYSASPPAELAAMFRTAGAKVIFVENPKVLAALRAAGGDQLAVRCILLTGEADDTLTLAGLRALGREHPSDPPEVGASDPAILYLTSGATGAPKMVLVNHHALVFNADMGPQMLPLGPQDRALVFLPSAHIAQRVVMEFVMIRLAVPLYFSESLARMPHELRSVKPTVLLAPPRVWERVYASICTEIKKRPVLTQRMFWGALGLGLRASRIRQKGEEVPAWMETALGLADRAVFSKIRERFGGSIKLAASGAAPLGKDLAEFYDAIGMPLIEGYGLTEGGVATLNPVDRPRIGSIVKALPGVELRLGDDNELLIRGDCLMMGYFNDPAATGDVIRDGWLSTGDIAEIDADGYVHITGRKKEMIVASNGKKIYPNRIEALFKIEPLVAQIVLVGDRMPYVSALLTLNPAAAEGLKGMEGMEGRQIAELARCAPVLDEVKRAVARVNKHLAPYEHIRKFRVLDRDFSIDQGELTPTMKVRRTRVLDNWKPLIQEMYAGKEDLL